MVLDGGGLESQSLWICAVCRYKREDLVSVFTSFWQFLEQLHSNFCLCDHTVPSLPLHVCVTPAFSLSYNTGYLIKMLNVITGTKVFFQMGL